MHRAASSRVGGFAGALLQVNAHEIEALSVSPRAETLVVFFFALRTFYSYCTAFVVPSDCIILWILDAAAAFEWRANLVKRPVECIRVGQPNALNAAKV